MSDNNPLKRAKSVFYKRPKSILSEIEENNPLTIAFVCNYGKHRSVGWAELLKFLYYSNATITHIGL